MSRVGKSLSIRLADHQLEFLEELAIQRSNTISEILRDFVQEKIEAKAIEKLAKTGVDFSVKTYYLLKQIVANSHENPESTLSMANAASDAVLETLDS